MTAATKSPGFIHLRIHSAYSLLEGALPVKMLAKLATKDAQPALAITDRNNLFGALEIAETMAGSGIQPITGCTLTLAAPEDETENGGAKRNGLNGHAGGPAIAGSIALFAKDIQGYKNLLKLVSSAFLDHSTEADTHVTWDELAANHAGLIALTGGPDGPVDRAIRNDDAKEARAQLVRLKEIFGNRLYAEIQRHGTAEAKRVEPELLKLAYELEIPLVATNQCYFPTRDDFDAP